MRSNGNEGHCRTSTNQQHIHCYAQERIPSVILRKPSTVALPPEKTVSTVAEVDSNGEFAFSRAS